MDVPTPEGSVSLFHISIFIDLKIMKFLKLILGKGVRENVGNVRQTGFMVVFMLEHDPIRFLLRHYDQ